MENNKLIKQLDDLKIGIETVQKENVKILQDKNNLMSQLQNEKDRLISFQQEVGKLEA